MSQAYTQGDMFGGRRRPSTRQRRRAMRWQGVSRQLRLYWQLAKVVDNPHRRWPLWSWRRCSPAHPLPPSVGFIAQAMMAVEEPPIDLYADTDYPYPKTSYPVVIPYPLVPRMG